MGVGLSLVNALIKLYGGTINAGIEKNEIIHFQVTLPITRDSFKEEDIRTSSMQLKSQEVLSEFIDVDYDLIDSKKEDLPILLIVEDYSEVRTFIKQALKKKYRILEAENGKVGLEIALSEVPDIILSDIRMPIYDGIQLCNALKIDERTSHIPIILLTAGVSEENELKGLASGADDFVTKPFKIKVLEQRMINLIAIRRALRNRYRQELILKPKEIAVTPADEVFLNRIQEILENHLSDPQFNAETFSQKAKVSRMQLHRKLLAYTGLSTSAFIRSQRLKQAIQILQTSDTTINEVAYTVGFNTPTYFMKCFKEVYKKTPSEYLQSLNKNNNS
jgi:YesN/AraC family two-component response regulator